MAKLVSKVYGDALMEAALEGQKVDALYEEAKALAGIWEENRPLAALLDNPKVVKEEKLELLEHIFQGRLSPDLLGFLTTVVEKGRHKEIPSILEYFISQVKEFKKIGTAYVASAVSLSDAQKAQVKERLLATTSYVEFEIHYTIDPSLIGGMVLRIGDRVVDSSIKTKLYELQKELVKIQLA
ncbi:MAG: ATP synthase F1 subunit delta [Lachnospiraceae bacterium]|jgi:F-type H+-transporting ATPase subunit delta|nr:ATP synthase F1 subunit delta [Lachnospiraceae bacterium]